MVATLCMTSTQVAVTPNDGNEFLTCEEKGYVRLYDLRVKTQCSCNGCTKVILIDPPTQPTHMYFTMVIDSMCDK